MTKREIADLLGYQFTAINKAFVAAEKRNPSLMAKKGRYNKNLSIDYSLEECLDALREYSPMEKQYLKDHFIHRDSFYKDTRIKKVHLPKEIKDFVFLYTHCNHIHAVCNTCEFLVPKKINKAGSRFHPYCTFYECFLNKQKKEKRMNVYKDRCSSFKYSRKTPYLWLKEGPTNLNIFLEQQEDILGREKSEYTSKKTAKGEAVVLLKDEEYDPFDE